VLKARRFRIIFKVNLAPVDSKLDLFERYRSVLKMKNSPYVSCKELKDESTHQRNLDFEQRVSLKTRSCRSDLKSLGPDNSSYGGRKDMRLVGIEASRRDLQLSFRCQRQIMKFSGSNIEVKVLEERISGFRGKNHRCTEVGPIYIEG
jgi:hypothetical protein